MDIEIHTKEILRIRERLNNIVVHHTGQAYDRVERDTERDFFMSATEARDYRLVDRVVIHRDEAA